MTLVTGCDFIHVIEDVNVVIEFYRSLVQFLFPFVSYSLSYIRKENTSWTKDKNDWKAAYISYSLWMARVGNTSHLDQAKNEIQPIDCIAFLNFFICFKTLVRDTQRLVSIPLRVTSSPRGTQQTFIREAPPRAPNYYPFIYHLDRKCTRFIYLLAIPYISGGASLYSPL